MGCAILAWKVYQKRNFSARVEELYCQVSKKVCLEAYMFTNDLSKNIIALNLFFLSNFLRLMSCRCSLNENDFCGHYCQKLPFNC